MAAKFLHRSGEAELLDAPGIPEELLFRNLRELDMVNRTLGGHAITLAGIKALVTDKSKTYTIADIGCGGGDAMKYIARWAQKNGFRVQLTGVDMNAACVAYTKKACRGFPDIGAVVMDYRDYLRQASGVDIVHCSLFCHHLDDEELIELFGFMSRHARCGFVINDLQRHWFAYYGIWLLTRLLNGSPLVKNDAPLSVLRGFRKSELLSLFEKAGIKNVSLRWRWAFRYLAIGKSNNIS